MVGTSGIDFSVRFSVQFDLTAVTVQLCFAMHVAELFALFALIPVFIQIAG